DEEAPLLREHRSFVAIVLRTIQRPGVLAQWLGGDLPQIRPRGLFGDREVQRLPRRASVPELMDADVDAIHLPALRRLTRREGERCHRIPLPTPPREELGRF